MSERIPVPIILSVKNGMFEAKEIVFCKDCKYYGKRFTSIIRGMHCLRYGEQMGAEDFCSRGEKK